jgi:acetylornithine deacetylase
MSIVVEHLKNLIRIPSISASSNRPVIEYAANAFRAEGWSFQEFVYLDACGTEKVNLVAAPPGQDVCSRDVEMAFFCHTDTVPYSIAWPHAIDPVLADGHLHGCGACDVKGSLACLLTAASDWRGNHCDGLRIVLTADEEIGCIGTAQLLASAAFRARRIVVCEPTSLHVARAGKGYCLARLVFTGREAHSAHPEKGASAIFAAAHAITAIETLSERLQQHCNAFFAPSFTTVNVGTIQGGSAKNIVPGHCEMLLEWRTIPGSTLTTDPVMKALQEIALQANRDDPAVICHVELLRHQSGFETRAKAALVKSIARMTNLRATSIAFGSEASLLAAVSEEIVVFGPGDMRTAHSDRECVAIIELDQAVAVMRSLMSHPGNEPDNPAKAPVRAHSQRL